MNSRIPYLFNQVQSFDYGFLFRAPIDGCIISCLSNQAITCIFYLSFFGPRLLIPKLKRTTLTHSNLLSINTTVTSIISLGSSSLIQSRNWSGACVRSTSTPVTVSHPWFCCAAVNSGIFLGLYDISIHKPRSSNNETDPR